MLRRYAPIFLALPLVNCSLAATLYKLGGPLAPVVALTVVSCIFPCQLYFAARSGEFGTRAGPLRRGTRATAYWATFAVLALLYVCMTGLMLGLVYWRMKGSL